MVQFKLSRVIFCYLVVICVCIVALAVCSQYVITPGLWAYNFKPTTCTVIGNKTQANYTCNCLSQSDFVCTSPTPCIKIEISYTIKAKNNSSIITTGIYKDEVIAFEKTNCSEDACIAATNRNFLSTYNDFFKKYGRIGSTYGCLYDPTDETKVIIRRRFNNASVICSLVIPIIVLLLLPILWAVTWIKRRKTDFQANETHEIHEFSAPCTER